MMDQAEKTGVTSEQIRQMFDEFKAELIEAVTKQVLSTVATRIEASEERMQAEIAAHKKQTNDRTKRHSERLDELTQQMAGLAANTATIQRGMIDNQSGISKLTESITGLTQKLDLMATTISNLQPWLDRQAQETDEVRKEAQRANERIDNEVHEANMSRVRLNNTMNGVKSEIDQVKTKVVETQAEVAGVKAGYADVAALAGRVNKIMALFDTRRRKLAASLMVAMLAQGDTLVEGIKQVIGML